MIREYLEHYRMDYTLSVFVPEAAMQGQSYHISRDKLAEQTGIFKEKEERDTAPLLIKML